MLLKTGINILRSAIGGWQYAKSADEAAKHQAQKYIAELLGSNNGVLYKVGQMLSSNAENLEFQKLFNQSWTPMNAETFIQEVEKALGEKIKKYFQYIDDKPFPASLSQVHRGCLKDGRKVAIKLKLPNIKRILEEQLFFLKLLPNLGPSKKWGLPLRDYKETLHSHIINELDYRQEAITLEYFYEQLNIPNILISQPIPHLCKDNLLVTTWIDGQPAQDILAELNQAEKKQLSQLLLQSFFAQIFKLNVLNTDTHHRNFLVTRQPVQLGLIDFGATIQITAQTGHVLANFIVDEPSLKNVDLISAWELLGFNRERLRHIQHKLYDLTKIIFEPFHVKKEFNIKSWKLSERVEKLLGNDRWWFRTAGDAKFFLIIKAFLSLKSLLQKLDQPVNWWKTAEPFLPQIHPLPTATMSSKPLNYIAQHIRIRITQEQDTLIQLDLPASLLLDLENYIEDHIKNKIRQRGMVIQEIIQQAHLAKAPPGILFKFHDQSTQKKYVIELI